MVTVRVVAENEAGRSSPAELSFTVPRSELVEWADAGTDKSEATTEKEKGGEGCPELILAPLTPPLGVTARRIPASDGGGVLINWIAPLFESEIDELSTEDKSDTAAAAAAKKKPKAGGDDKGRRRSLLQESGAAETDALDGSAGKDVSAATIGYQVTWAAWNEDTMPGVEPLVSVVLSEDGDNTNGAVTRHASSPCGDKGADAAACFYVDKATSLRLEGLLDDTSYAFAVRALTPGGTGPLSAPFVLPALTAPEAPEDAETLTGEPTAPSGATDDVTTKTPESGQIIGEGIGADGSLLPAAPPLTQDVVRLEQQPLYEAERIGGIYDQLATQYPVYSPTAGAYDPNVGALEETTREEVLADTGGGLLNPYGGIGGFGDYGGLGYGGLGYGGLGEAPSS